MMKKLLLLLAALMLLALPACAEETALFRLETTAADGSTMLLGSAVLLDDITFVASVHAFDQAFDGDVFAVNESGSYKIVSAGTPNATSEIALLETAESVPGYQIWADNFTDPIPTVIRGHNLQGEAVSLPVSGTTQLAGYINGREVITFSCPVKLLPGATLYDPSGALVGLVVADWCDRLHGLAALTVNTIDLELSSDAFTTPADDPYTDEVWLEDFALTCEDGVITLDWSQSAAYDPTASSVVFCSYGYNPFFTYEVLDPGVTGTYFFSGPGEWSFWIKQTHREDPMENTNYHMHYPRFLPLEVEFFTDHGFQSVKTSIGIAPVGTGDVITGWTKELEKVTVKELTDPATNLYIQLHDTYNVTQSVDANSCLMLHTPDQCMLMLSGSYTFSPEGNKGDIYGFSVDELFDDYIYLNESGTFIPGEYSLVYCINGQVASIHSFTLE